VPIVADWQPTTCLFVGSFCCLVCCLVVVSSQSICWYLMDLEGNFDPTSGVGNVHYSQSVIGIQFWTEVLSPFNYNSSLLLFWRKFFFPVRLGCCSFFLSFSLSRPFPTITSRTVGAVALHSVLYCVQDSPTVSSIDPSSQCFVVLFRILYWRDSVDILLQYYSTVFGIWCDKSEQRFICFSGRTFDRRLV
jgi:hypothetical protein